MGAGLESCQVCKTFSTPLYKQFYCKSSARTGFFRKKNRDTVRNDDDDDDDDESERET